MINEDFRNPEPTTTDDDPDIELFNFAAFRDNGLLWALNRYVMHPRGLAVAWFTAEGDDQPCGWQVYRSNDGLWQFDAGLDHIGQAKFQALESYVWDRPTKEI